MGNFLMHFNRRYWTVLLAMFVVLSNDFDAYASGISSDTSAPTCDYGTLETYVGPVGLSANYAPNEIPLRWYNMNTLIQDVPAVSNSCEYDSALTVPSTPPTRTGYDFAGWTVRPNYDFNQLNTSIDGNVFYAKVYNYGDLCNGGSTYEECTDASYSDLQTHEWKVSFSYGTIYGMSKCSSSSGDGGSLATNINDTLGPYCWCKVTGFIPSGQTTVYGTPENFKWFGYASAGDNGYCLYRCAVYCGWVTRSNIIGSGSVSTFDHRAKLFGQVQ